MIIKDLVYGEFYVDGVIEELINTKAVQRLKEIHQNGGAYLVNPKWCVTRYEHSIGVMILIKRLGGSLQEQIAGLLHDVSHTAFSHVVDTALKCKEEDYHEKIYSDVIEKSEIPMVLDKYGYNYKNILESESKWTILEKSAPDLCADRVDYTLRDMLSCEVIDKEEIDEFLKYIKVKDGDIVITSLEKAEWFVEIYYKEVIGFFMNPLSIYSSDRLSKALRISLESNELGYDDFLKTDNEVLSILKNSKDNKVRDLIKSINYNVEAIENKDDYDIHIVNKLRTIDPPVVIEDKIYKSSEKSNFIKELTLKSIKRCKDGAYIKIIKN